MTPHRSWEKDRGTADARLRLEKKHQIMHFRATNQLSRQSEEQPELHTKSDLGLSLKQKPLNDTNQRRTRPLSSIEAGNTMLLSALHQLRRANTGTLARARPIGDVWAQGTRGLGITFGVKVRYECA